VIHRPAGIVIGGDLHLGLEFITSEGVVEEVRPHTGLPEPWFASPAFVNAHSHLEYRGMQGQLKETDFFEWIGAIVRAKGEQTPEQVQADSLLAAQENRATGVALIAEHSDRPGSRAAMDSVGLEGPIFQEVITFLDPAGRQERLAHVAEKARLQAATPSPHATYSVDKHSLTELSQGEAFLSTHAAESPAETELFSHGTGPFAELLESHNSALPQAGQTPIEYLNRIGFLKPGRQLVHCCDATEQDIELMAAKGVVAAHCPRSNQALTCTPAPIRRILEAGIPVGLGLDSAASSGQISMFAEMRSAFRASCSRREPITYSQIWQMATEMGAASLGRDNWSIQAGSTAPIIRISGVDAIDVEDLIESCSPENVSWLDTA
jgi:cytosine/adenosine deaminase-related metal-dependent hydrolase